MRSALATQDPVKKKQMHVIMQEATRDVNVSSVQMVLQICKITLPCVRVGVTTLVIVMVQYLSASVIKRVARHFILLTRMKYLSLL